MANPVTPFALCYPAPWRLQGAEVVDRDGCHVHGFDDDDPDHVEFWRGVVEAVNRSAQLDLYGTLKQKVAEAEARFAALSPEAQAAHMQKQRESFVRGQIAMGDDRDELAARAAFRAESADPVNLAGSGPTPVEPREG